MMPLSTTSATQRIGKRSRSMSHSMRGTALYLTTGVAAPLAVETISRNLQSMHAEAVMESG
jgi:hypothetical protein